MKTPILLLLLCFSSVILTAQFNNGFDLVIQQTGISTPVEIYNGDDLLTGSRFTIDAVIQVPIGCEKAVVTFEVPAYVELDLNQSQPIVPGQWQCISPNACRRPSGISLDQAYTIEVESLPGTFDTSTETGSLNIQYNMYQTMGDLCEGVQQDFQFSVEYFDDQDNSCNQSISEVTSFFSKYVENYWPVDLVEETPDSDICLGGYRKYRIDVPYKNSPGGYNSAAGAILVAAIGEVFRLYDNNYNELQPDYFCSGNDCLDSCRPGFILEHDFRVGQSKTSYYLVVNFDCNGCDYVAEYNAFSNFPNGAVASIVKPCETNFVEEILNIELFDPNLLSSSNSCCGGGYSGTTSFRKDHTYTQESLCPGSCNSTAFTINYDNSLSANDLTGFCITDDVPVHYDINTLRFNRGNQTYFSSSSSNSASVTFLNNTTSEGPFTIDGSNYNQNFFSSNSISIDYDQIEICYNQIVPAFSGKLNMYYFGAFNANNQIGDLIDTPVNTNNGYNASPPIVEIGECDSDLQGYVRANKAGVNYTSSLKVDRGDKATVRMYIYNSGTATINNVDLDVNLPSNFTYCPGTVRFYYGTGSMTSVPDPDIGGTWDETGNTLSLNNFTVPQSCLNGNKRFEIEIDILTNQDAIAGPNSVGFTINNSYTRSTNITVNSIYNVSTKAGVSCVLPTCSDLLEDTISVIPGDILWYRYDIINDGNVVLDAIELINNIPALNNQTSDCMSVRGGDITAIRYLTTESSCVIPNLSEEYSTTNCPATYSSTFDPSAESIRWTSISPTLMPGETFSIIAQYEVDPAAQLGQIGINDFAFTANRNDLNQVTELQLSNPVVVEVEDMRCPEICTNDTTPPVINCPTQPIVEIQPDGTASVDFSAFNITATDNCDTDVDIAEVMVNRDCSDLNNAAIFHSVIATDDSGNTSSCIIGIFLTDPNGYCNDNCMDFDGINDALEIANLSSTPNFSATAWFKAEPTSISTSEDRIISFGPSERLEIGIEQGDAEDGEIWIYDNERPGGAIALGVFVRDGTWHHIAVTRDGTNGEVYLDGSPIFSYTANNPPSGYGPKFAVGRWAINNSGGTEFFGQIEDVALWDRALTQAEITDQQSCSLIGSEPGLTAFYDFNLGISEGDNISLPNISDRSGNGNDLAILDIAMNGPSSNLVTSTTGLINDCILCENPVAMCNNNLTLTVDTANPTATVNISDIDNGSSSNCGAITLSFDASSIVSTLDFDCPVDLGEQLVTLYVNDMNGSQSSCTSTVDIISTQPDLEAFVDFYESTNGDNWTNNTGWLTNCDPCGLEAGNEPWFGLTCWSDDNKVRTMNLTNNNLTGSLPASINSFDRMTWFLVGRNSLTGSFPDICNWENLLFLSVGNPVFGNNNFNNSPLPPCLNTFENIIGINAENAGFTGTLPNFDPTLQEDLRQLDLSGNQLTGNIPANYGDFSWFSMFVISDNNLSGCYDPDLFSLCANAITSNATISDGNNFDIDWEDFCSGDLETLIDLYESTNGDNWNNTIAGDRPWFEDCDPCGEIDGTPWYGLNCTHLFEVQRIVLSSNNLTGEIENVLFSNMPSLKRIIFAVNNLTGEIPDICSMDDLQQFNVAENEMSGEIQSNCFIDMDLIQIALKDNNFSGPLPNMGTISELLLSGNCFDGNIPISYSGLTNLNTFTLNDNKLAGCYDPNLFSLCANVITSNATISDGNNFVADWEDFCATGAGKCCEPNITLDGSLISSGVYEASNSITIVGCVPSSLDIMLNAPTVIMDSSFKVEPGAVVTTQMIGCQ